MKEGRTALNSVLKNHLELQLLISAKQFSKSSNLLGCVIEKLKQWSV